MSPARNASRGRLSVSFAAALMLALVAALAYVPGHAADRGPLSVAQKGVGPEMIYGQE